MTTFSQLIDDLAAELLRPDLRTMMVEYANQTIREIHIDQNTSMPIGFTSNLIENQLVMDGEDAYNYVLPRPHLFQFIESVYYNAYGIYAEPRTPATALIERDSVYRNCYYYRSGNVVILNGHGGFGATVLLAHFEFPRRLQYYKEAVRPASWNEESQSFTYLDSYNGDADSRAHAEELSTNWLCDRWEPVVKQGVRAKVLSRLKDVEPAKIAYSQYQALRPGLVEAERYVNARFVAA